MKKLLGIVVLGFLFCNSVYAEVVYLKCIRTDQKKEAKSIKKIFITLFLLGALIYMVKFLIDLGSN